MKNLRTKIFILSFLSLSSGQAFAGGVAISEISARDGGRGTASAAIADGPATIFFNPANLTRLTGLQAEVGATLIAPRWGYKDNAGAQTKSNSSAVVPPAVSVAYNFGDIKGFGTVAAGLGFYVPYGAAFSWPSSWPGRTEVQKIDLTVFELNPVVAFSPHKKVSLAVGFRYLPTAVYLKRAVALGSENEGDVELGGNGQAFGANAGLTLLPIEKLALAFSWRSGTTLKVKGNGDFTFPGAFAPLAVDKNVEASLPLAQVFRVGAAYELLPQKLTLSADLEYQLWNTYKSLDITFIENDGSRQINQSARDSKNSLVAHVGGEYKILDNVAVRAGYVYDQKTLPEYTVNPAPPDSDRHQITVGGSYYYGRYAVHAFASGVFFAERETQSNPLPGTWSGAGPGGIMAYLVGLSVSAAFDFGCCAQDCECDDCPEKSSSSL